MPQPIGISFLPSDQNQAQGPRMGGTEGNLGQAMKILSLTLPRRPQPHAVAPASLLEGQGSAGAGVTGPNPLAAIFQALLHAGQSNAGQPATAQLPSDLNGTGGTSLPPTSFLPPPAVVPPPHITLDQMPDTQPTQTGGMGLPGHLGNALASLLRSRRY